MTVQDQILDLLREKSGAIVDAYNVAEHIGKAINIPAGRVRDALGALQARGLVTHENIRTAALTEEGWGANGSAGPVVAGAPPAEVARTRSTPAPSSPAAPVQHAKEVVVAKKKTVRDLAIAELRRRGGRLEDAGGKCVGVLATAIRAKPDTVATALATLVAEGVITKNSKQRIGTTSIVLTDGKGATNGDVSELRGGDRLGDDGQREAPAVRRKAKQGRRPQRRASGGKRPTGRRTVRKGRRRVDAAPHDVPASEGLAEAELRVLAGITRLFIDLSPIERDRVVAFMVDAFGARKR